jgi:hypothetical protein
LQDARGPAFHFHRRTAGKRQQENSLRIGAGDHQMRDAMRHGIGLARARAGDDQQWSIVTGVRTDAMLDDATLLRIEGGEVGVGARSWYRDRHWQACPLRRTIVRRKGITAWRRLPRALPGRAASRLAATVAAAGILQSAARNSNAPIPAPIPTGMP